MHYDAYGVGYHNYNINIGENIGKHSLSARINWPEHNREVNPENNITSNSIITVKPAINLQITAIQPNRDYRQGVEVVTSFIVKNISRHDILPSAHLSVTLSIQESKNTKNRVIVSVKTKVVIPANNENLVYWKWTVPQNTAGQEWVLTAAANMDGAVDETDTSDNCAVITRTIKSDIYSQTPDTHFESNAPAGFIATNPPNPSSTNAHWSEWVYDNNRFVKKEYGIQISTSILPQLIPDSNAPSSQYMDGFWHIRTGYGFSFSFKPELNRIGAPDSVAYTLPQSGYAAFPEFKYSTMKNEFRTLERTGNSFSFFLNPDAARNVRLHFMPLWYPNGSYAVSSYFYDCWSPAGMISATLASSTLITNGSAYDDWYVTKK